MNPSHTAHRPDPSAAPANETQCVYCDGKGEIVTRFANSIDPGAVREFRQTCSCCGGSGKVFVEGAEQ